MNKSLIAYASGRAIDIFYKSSIKCASNLLDINKSLTATIPPCIEQDKVFMMIHYNSDSIHKEDLYGEQIR